MGDTTRVEGGVHADRGGVAAGRDVVARLLVSGNRNTFFVGGYQRLEEAYIDPWSVFERVRLEHFAGRAWLDNEVDRFLQENDRGYFVFEAKAGLGKSTFLAHLVRERGWISHFVELAPGEAGVVPARKNLAAQVMRAFELAEGGEEAVLPDEAASRPDFLSDLLRKAAEKRKDGEKIVLVVDGLDDAGTRAGENVLGLPRVLPGGVFFLVSKRPVPVALTVERPRRVIKLDAESDANLDDARAYLHAATSWEGVACALRESTSPTGGSYSAAEFVEALLANSGGVWVYLHFVLADIDENHRSSAGAHPPLDLDALPQGLWAYYADFWHRWKDGHREEWHGLHRPLLAALAATREEVTLGRLCTLAGIDEVPELPERWRPFLVVQRGEKPMYRLYHKSLEDFLHGRAEQGELADDEEDFADELGQATRDAHDRIASRYLSAWKAVGDEPAGPREARLRELDDGYGSRHLTTHLRLARRLDDLFALMDDEAWESGRLTVDPSGTVLMLDLRAAWIAADEADAEAIRNDRTAPWLGREVASACATARLRSLAETVSPTLLGALVATGTWSPALALGLIANQTSASRQAESLEGLACALQRVGAPADVGVMRMALAIVDAIEDERARCRALTAIVPMLNDPLIANAFMTAKGFDDEGVRADALAAIADRLPEGLVGEALIAATGIPVVSGSLYPIVGLARRLDVDQRQTLITAAGGWAANSPLRQPETRNRLPELNPGLAGSWYALVAALPRAEQDQLFQESLESIRQIETDVNRLPALPILAEYLPAHLMSDLLEIFEACHPPHGWSDQWDALVGMAPRLPEPLIGRAFEAAQRITDPYGRVEAIAALAPRLPPEQRDVALTNAFEAIRTIPLDRILIDGFWRALPSLALIRLAPELPAALLEDALDVAHQIPFPDGQSDALAAVALRLPGPRRDELISEAFRIARQPASDPAVQARTLYALTVQLPEDEQPRLISSLLPMVERIRDLRDFVEAASEVAWRLDDGELLHAAIDVAREAPQPHTRAFALTSVAVRSTEEARRGLLDEALDAVRTIDDPIERGTTYARIAARLTETERDDVALQALQAARAGFSEHNRRLTELLARLAPLLPPGAVPDALELARRLDRAAERATVLASLAPRLPNEQQQSVAAEALENAREFQAEFQQTLRGSGLSESSDEPMTLLFWDKGLLGALAPWLPEAELRLYVEEAIARAYGDGGVAGGELKVLAPTIPNHMLADAFKAASKIRDDKGLSDALAGLASRARGELAAEAFLAASRIVDDDARTAVLGMLASSVAELERRQLYPLWQEVLEACASRGSRAVVAAIGELAAVVSRLGGEPGVRATIGAIHQPP